MVGRLRALFEGERARPWSARETKPLQVWLAEQSLELAAPAFDVELAAQLLDPSGSRSVEVARVASSSGWRSRTLGGSRRARREGAPRERDRRGEQVAAWAGAQACAAQRLEAPLARELAETGMDALYRTAELPLTRVLARMERAGVRIDEAALARLSRDYTASSRSSRSASMRSRASAS